MLELLPCPVLVRVADGLAVDFIDVWETVDDEGTEENGVRNLVVLNSQASKCLQSLQLRDLYETIDVVILEDKPLQVDKPLQLRDVGWTDNVVEADVLEGDLSHCLLELGVVQYFKGITVDEEELLAFDLCVT